MNPSENQDDFKTCIWAEQCCPGSVTRTLLCYTQVMKSVTISTSQWSYLSKSVLIDWCQCFYSDPRSPFSCHKHLLKRLSGVPFRFIVAWPVETALKNSRNLTYSKFSPKCFAFFSPTLDILFNVRKCYFFEVRGPTNWPWSGEEKQKKQGSLHPWCLSSIIVGTHESAWYNSQACLSPKRNMMG